MFISPDWGEKSKKFCLIWCHDLNTEKWNVDEKAEEEKKASQFYIKTLGRGSSVLFLVKKHFLNKNNACSQ